jgi:hypothetical protein
MSDIQYVETPPGGAGAVPRHRLIVVMVVILVVLYALYLGYEAAAAVALASAAGYAAVSVARRLNR